MRRHLDDHSSLNSSGIYGSTSLPVQTTASSNPSPRVLGDINESHISGDPGSGVPATTVGGSTSPASNLSLRHQGRTGVAPISPGLAPSGNNKPSVQRQPLALIQETVHAVGASASTEMQAGVHYSVQQPGYQSRVTSGSSLSPAASHGHNLPSSVHHSHSVQAQAHTPQIVHQPPAHPQTHVTQLQGQQHQMQFQRLKVEDALSYLDQVKYKFGSQPQVYNDFLDIMKEFKSQSIDTPGVIQRVSNLFRGHPELIVGFNTFLPPGYRIEVQSNEQVQVSISGSAAGSPGSCNTITSVTIHPTGNPSNPNVHSSHGSQSNHTGHTPSSHLSPSNANKTSNHQVPVTSSQMHQTSQNQHSYNQLSPSHQSSGTSPSVHSPTSTPQASQPVEFNHAINYVNKIKNRFHGQPDIYKQFLEILHTYQKEQKNLKDGTHTGTKPLTEAEVYSQVAKLFQNQDDLLQEFGQFLPDANGAANALVSLQPPKATNNDHVSTTKKSAVPSKPTPPPVSNQSKQVPAIKRPASSVPSQPVKKPKMTSLKDVTLAEAGKCGTLTEYAYFDKVRKSIKCQEVYESFLRCLYLYNQEVVSKTDLVSLVTPLLTKHAELLKWFRDFLGCSEISNNIETIPNKVATQERERITGDFATEIDYSSCIKYGASYREVPRNYVQPKCSGRTALCREVLNDTWVSFPAWSEDSTFVSSRKTQYEEYIYRCEDERFELDVVLETNQSTISVLESVQTKMNRMNPEEKARLRLDDTLGGSSTVLHQRAIKRIYGDKAPDVIEGLKKSPAIAVPLVLRRLKAKEEEWAQAKKSFNKIWKEQNEKYYLKSLDHQGITFKQNDIKYLRSKSILNEIEAICEERHEQAEDGLGDVPIGPHIITYYKDKNMLDDAANLIIHHVKRQTGIHKEDKQRIKQLMRQFIPDFFSVPRGELSDDEIDKDDDMETEDGNDSRHGCSYTDLLNLKVNNGTTNNSYCPNEIKSEDSGVTKAEKNTEKSCVSGNSIMESFLPGDSYALMYLNNNWYLFFRLHQLLCERLGKLHERAQILIAEEIRDREERKKSTALALRLKPKNDIDVEEYYPTFLDMVKNLLDGNMESNAYEDTLRDMFGIYAYLGFTLDKVVQNAVRQLQHIVGDDGCIQCTNLFLEEQKANATGGSCATASQRCAAESLYQKKAENMLTDDACFRIVLYKNEGKITFEMLDSDSDPCEDPIDADRWSRYMRKYSSGEEAVSSEVKEQLAKKPVFLPRNVRTWREHSARKQNETKGNSDKINAEMTLNNLHDMDLENKIDLSRLEDGSAGEAVKGLVGLNAKAILMDRTRQKELSEGSDQDAECRFNLNSYKMLFVVHGDSSLYRRMALRKARQSHQKVSLRLNKKFRAWHRLWLEENVSADQEKLCTHWLLGLVEDSLPSVCVKVDNPTKPPYACYNRYKLKQKEKS